MAGSVAVINKTSDSEKQPFKVTRTEYAPAPTLRKNCPVESFKMVRLKYHWLFIGLLDLKPTLSNVIVGFIGFGFTVIEIGSEGTLTNLPLLVVT